MPHRSIAIVDGQRLDDLRRSRPPSTRPRCARGGAARGGRQSGRSATRVPCRAARGSARSVASTSTARVRGRRGVGEESLEVVVGPGPAALLDEPPARDVPQQADATHCTLLVAEPGGLRGDAGVRVRLLAADEQPGAGGHERLARAAPPSTADAVSWPPTRCTGTPRQEPTPVPPGRIGQQHAGEAMASHSSSDQFRVARSSSPVVPALVVSATISPVRCATSELREHDDVRGARELGRIVGRELEDRVERRNCNPVSS